MQAEAPVLLRGVHWSQPRDGWLHSCLGSEFSDVSFVSLTLANAANLSREKVFLSVEKIPHIPLVFQQETEDRKNNIQKFFS